MKALTTCNKLPAMSVEAVEAVRQLGLRVSETPQIPVPTYHVLHAGLYARTIKIPAGSVLCGVLIKRATLLVAEGDATVWVGDHEARIAGYNVIPASAHRRQAYLAHSDVNLTMIFPTSARNVEEAENEFTDEVGLLFSRHGENVVVITGE